MVQLRAGSVAVVSGLGGSRVGSRVQLEMVSVDNRVQFGTGQLRGCTMQKRSNAARISYLNPVYWLARPWKKIPWNKYV